MLATRRYGEQPDFANQHSVFKFSPLRFDTSEVEFG